VLITLILQRYTVSHKAMQAANSGSPDITNDPLDRLSEAAETSSPVLTRCGTGHV